MKLVGLISTAVLSLTLAAAAPIYAQEQHDQQEEQKDKPAQEKEKKAQPAKPTKQEEKKAPQQDKNTKQDQKTSEQQNKNAQQQEKASQQQDKNARNQEKNAQQKPQHTQQAKPQQQAQNHNGGGRIPDDRYRAHFGQEHRFRVTQANYSSRRFQYGGYWFGFVDVWPSNWLYTEDVFVVDIDGVYYLCNPMYPGVNVALSVTL